MPRFRRRTDADYVRFPPYYVFKSHPNQKARNEVIELAWGTSLIIAVLGIVFAAAFLLMRHYFTSV